MNPSSHVVRPRGREFRFKSSGSEFVPVRLKCRRLSKGSTDYLVRAFSVLDGRQLLHSVQPNREAAGALVSNLSGMHYDTKTGKFVQPPKSAVA